MSSPIDPVSQKDLGSRFRPADGEPGNGQNIDRERLPRPGPIRAEAEQIAIEAGLSGTISYREGRVADVRPDQTGTFGLIHDDAWFADAPEHLESMIGLLRPGSVLTMANGFLLVDALTGEPRNHWERFAGPDWSARTLKHAQQLVDRTDLDVNWITTPPMGIATKHS